jgi:3-oxoacyl-[acyl-carrier protein] reductase
MKLKNLVAIITGASSGVGAEIAKILAEEGCNILVNYHENAEGARKVVKICRGYGVEAMAYKADMSSPRQCTNMVEAAYKKWGMINILVNNAATTKQNFSRNLDDIKVEDFRHIFAVNTFGPFVLIKGVVPYMKKARTGGVIVNISSITGKTGFGPSLIYAASKGALDTLTKGLAIILSPKIRVNAVRGGFIDSAWWDKHMPDAKRLKVFKRCVKSASLLQKLIKPQDIAKTVKFLIEDETITGQIITQDAGLQSHLALLEFTKKCKN